MAKKTHAVVMNLKARQAKKLAGKIESMFEKEGLNLKKLYQVENPKQIEKSLSLALRQKPDVLVLAGGDGTLIAGIEYAIKKGFKGCVGVLPLGTANYLARDLGIPLNLASAVSVIKNAKPRFIPLGEAHGKYFSLTLTIGLTEKISDNVSHRAKKRLGQLAYIIEGFKHTNSENTFSYELTCPNIDEPLRGSTHQIVVYNANLNQQVTITPHHSLHKNTLKVVVYDSGNRVIRLFISLLAHIISLGRLKPYMHVLETDSLKIETTPKRKLDYDGEVRNFTPVDISIIPDAIKILH